MILEDGIVVLRPWRAGDAAVIAPILDEPRVTRFSSIADGVEEWLEAQHTRTDRVSLAITSPDDDRPAGRVALRFTDRELSYWLLPAARGRGLATRAARLLATHGLTTVGLPYVKLEIEDDNEPSLRLAGALGAAPTGETRTEVDRTGVARRLVVFHLRGAVATA